MTGNGVANGNAAPPLVDGGQASTTQTMEQTQAAIDRLKEQMNSLDVRKERMMKSRPTVRR